MLVMIMIFSNWNYHQRRRRHYHRLRQGDKRLSIDKRFFIRRRDQFKGKK